jgi:hypothetical protein
MELEHGWEIGLQKGFQFPLLSTLPGSFMEKTTHSIYKRFRPISPNPHKYFLVLTSKNTECIGDLQN